MLNLEIKKYTDDMQEKWDEFVQYQSCNGTFLQTRNFLNYHGNKFKDASFAIYKGQGTIVAVVPACLIEIRDKKVFYSHAGSTFGGIVIGKAFYNIEHVDAIMQVLEVYWREQGYDEVKLRQTSTIFAKRNIELLDYFLYKYGYIPYDELSSYVDFEEYREDVISNFSAGRRRDYKYALKNALAFRKIEKDEEIMEFYQLLCLNLEKYETQPVHSCSELVDFKNQRLKDIVEFYAVYMGEKMVAGSMVFKFENRVFHTQYLAADPIYLKFYTMNYLDGELISLAMRSGYRFFSFGISTEEQGRILNKSLAQFKEGFGTQFGINRTYTKKLGEEYHE